MLSHREPTGAELRRAARRNNTEAHGEGRRPVGGAHALAGPVPLDSHCTQIGKRKVKTALIAKKHTADKTTFPSREQNNSKDSFANQMGFLLALRPSVVFFLV